MDLAFSSVFMECLISCLASFLVCVAPIVYVDLALSSIFMECLMSGLASSLFYVAPIV